MKLSAILPKPRQAVHLLARAFVCGILMVLPSCMIPTLRQADSAPDLPPTFVGVSSSESSAKLGVDEFFKDPVLTELIDEAVLNNRELKVLEEEIEVARNEAMGRSGAYFPFLNLGAGASLERTSFFTPAGALERKVEYLPGKVFPDPIPNFSLGANFIWQLDIFRELRNTRDAARQRYFAAIERRGAFMTRMVADVAENYFRLMALDKRMETIDQTIALQEESAKLAKAKMEAGRGTELAVLRFQAEVKKNQSEKFIVTQDVVEAENRINFLLNRFPQPVGRRSAGFFDIDIPFSVGVPAELLANRPDIRQAEFELQAAGLDVLVARAQFFPKLYIRGGVGYQAINTKYLFLTPESVAANIAGDLVAPLINKIAIQAQYRSANAKQLEAVYNYQKTVLNGYVEVVNRMTMAENYRRSYEIKKQQLAALEASVEAANKLFQNARAEYAEVLFAQRDLRDARLVQIDTKRQQLAAIVAAYQALGGGANIASPTGEPPCR
ncbi:MAG: TolC family protein [Gemmataceae bacterium]|nr:TolC family protein [Gemmataceae bacterium]